MLFFSDIKQYIPVKLWKTAGRIHLLQIYGPAHLKPNHFRKKLPMGCYQNRMGRSVFDFEWSNSTVAHIS